MADPLDDALDFVAGAMRAVSAANAGARYSNSDATSGYSYASSNRDSIYPDPAAAIPDDGPAYAVDSINAGLDKMADHCGGLGRGKQDVGTGSGVRDHGGRGLHPVRPATVRDEAGTQVRILESQLAGVEALGRINEDGYEADIKRLTRERDDWKARAEKAERKLTDRAQCCLTMEDALANLWRIADVCPRCCNAVEAERAAAVLEKTVGSHAHHMKTAGGARRPAESPADYPDGNFSPSGTSFVCEVGIHEPGGPCPPGYMDRQEWHRVQQKAGHRQIYRPCCGLWLYPFEPHDPFCSAGKEASA